MLQLSRLKVVFVSEEKRNGRGAELIHPPPEQYVPSPEPLSCLRLG